MLGSWFGSVVVLVVDDDSFELVAAAAVIVVVLEDTGRLETAFSCSSDGFEELANSFFSFSIVVIGGVVASSLVVKGVCAGGMFPSLVS